MLSHKNAKILDTCVARLIDNRYITYGIIYYIKFRTTSFNNSNIYIYIWNINIGANNICFLYL